MRSDDHVPVASPSSELVPVQRRYRNRVPDHHRVSLDTRIVWLWNQRFGTVQTVWKDSPDVLDHTAATLILQAILGKDLDSIAQIFQRLEGGPVVDEELLDGSVKIRV
jgi:hypothetical protein